MSFTFKTEDTIEKLPEKLKTYFPVFIKKRKYEFDNFSRAVKAGNLEGFSAFYHNQVGIVASYHLFRYEELVEELKHILTTKDKEKVHKHLDAMNVYLTEILELSKNLK